MCEFNTKITRECVEIQGIRVSEQEDTNKIVMKITQLLRLAIVSAKSKFYSPRRGYLSPGNFIVLGIAATHFIIHQRYNSFETYIVFFRILMC